MNALLTFGTPDEGWLAVTFTGADFVHALDVSDVPGDSLRELAVAALRIVNGDGAEVTWFLEPAEVTWRFVVTEGVAVLSAWTQSDDVLELVRGAPEQLARIVWEAMARLASDPAWGDIASGHVWSNPFPSAEVAELGARLGASGR